MQSVKSSSSNAGLVRPQAVGPELNHLVEDRSQLFFDDYTEYDVSDVTKSVLSFSFLDRINVDIFQKYLPHVDRSGGLTEKYTIVLHFKIESTNFRFRNKPFAWCN